jgi:hypothetical protein
MNKNETLDLNKKNFGFWDLYRKFCLKKNNEESKKCQELYRNLFQNKINN